ncbi:tRNA modification GTPase MnmE [Geobacter sp. OR-1]|uniref:tRNA uridine-5-carboxymethylaminomethyl(34) synthesis GTPase MnmE n=1 Tax=Geobacter sp. OR-1 TaxID=1266765 RepID=UPI000543809E|nr:tRNA uridine-5-carboxymethylaminomethyl(34) synthesis GTPase MnmE [Geobacter sp. OR-1]GAM08501.1 tRNA modification GTPase MnmE [Geobacter sp. OR-1]
MYIRDTIAAISTPVGEGGIGIVRISGNDAARIGAAIFRSRQDGGFRSHRFCYGTIVTADGDILDEGCCVLMRAPRSYTKEDVFEIHCHGGVLVTRKVLEQALAAGARLAAPGEFTKRAFLNGRIDLLQAEAVMDVIRSKTDAALRMAEHQREGVLSGRITEIRDSLRDVAAMVEAHIDFPEEDIELPIVEDLKLSITTAIDGLSTLLTSFNEGKVLRDGVSVAIAGKPNAGKSSLLNALLREERAIVTELPGTTRDVIEEVINIQGLPVRLLDTAGIRETSDLVEQLGIDLALDRISRADLVLFILDRSRPLDTDDLRIHQETRCRNILVVRNKSDLPEAISMPDLFAGYPVVDISTVTGEGIDRLRSEIHGAFISGTAVDSREYAAISQERHFEALTNSVKLLQGSLAALSFGQLEIVAIDVREALGAIGEVTGETTPDDVLDLVFSRFCIGK